MLTVGLRCRNRHWTALLIELDWLITDLRGAARIKRGLLPQEGLRALMRHRHPFTIIHTLAVVHALAIVHSLAVVHPFAVIHRHSLAVVELLIGLLVGLRHFLALLLPVDLLQVALADKVLELAI